MHGAIIFKMSNNVQAMAPPCPVSSKKERCFCLSFPQWSPRPKESHFHDPGTRRTAGRTRCDNASPFCAPDVDVFQVSGAARGVSPALSPSLPSRPECPTQMSHCRQNPLLMSFFHPAISTPFAKNQSSKVNRLLQGYVLPPLAHTPQAGRYSHFLGEK